MNRLTLLLAGSVLAVSAAAQPKPCFALNDSSTTVIAAVTAASMAGPGMRAYQVTPTTNLLVQGGRIVTGSTYRDTYMSLEIWSHDTAAQTPKVRLAGGTWKIDKGAPPAWQGANFDAPVLLGKGTTYWVVWVEPGWCNVPQDPAGTVSVKAAYSSGSGWTSLSSLAAFKCRLYCQHLETQGAAVRGKPCPAAGKSLGTLFTNHVPARATAGFRIEGTGLPPGAATLLMIGRIKGFQGLDLTALGAPGCFLYTDILTSALGTTGTGDVRSQAALGHVHHTLPIPSSPVLAGAFLRLQLAALDKGSANPLPLVFTNALDVTVQ